MCTETPVMDSAISIHILAVRWTTYRDVYTSNESTDNSEDDSDDSDIMNEVSLLVAPALPNPQ